MTRPYRLPLADRVALALRVAALMGYLGALAIAEAYHDARKRWRETWSWR